MGGATRTHPKWRAGSRSHREDGLPKAVLDRCAYRPLLPRAEFEESRASLRSSDSVSESSYFAGRTCGMVKAMPRYESYCGGE